MKMTPSTEDLELKARVESLLAEFDGIKTLECDGFCRVGSRVLAGAGVAHEVVKGYVETPDGAVDPHYWMQVGSWKVDYRLRLWAGDNMPHGVFYPPDEVRYYEDSIVDLACPDVVFEVLTGRKP